MRRAYPTRPGLAALLALTVLAACAGQPPSPEERRAMELETYCRSLAEDETAKGATERDDGQVDSIGEDDQTWEETAEGGGFATKAEAAYAECMKKNAPKGQD
jgi:hypothetical protein